MMKISVVTAVFNRAATIKSAIDSVSCQSLENREFITVDGMSSDATPEIIAAHASVISKQIREPDNGIYDALNKGIRTATGDIVGFLHADDLFAGPDVLQKILDKFLTGDFDAIYGDLVYVGFDDPNQVIRYWKSGPFQVNKFRRGWMPPHPTVYIRKEIYQRLGMYRTDLGSAADYECLIRLMVKNQIRVGYIPEVLVKMRVGGKSNASLKNRWDANRNDYRAWTENELRPPYGLRLLKPLSKIPQYIFKPKA